MPAVDRHRDLLDRESPTPAERGVVVDHAARAPAARLREHRERGTRRRELGHHRAVRRRHLDLPEAQRRPRREARGPRTDVEHQPRGQRDTEREPGQDAIGRLEVVDGSPLADLTRARDHRGRVDAIRSSVRARERVRTAAGVADDARTTGGRARRRTPAVRPDSRRRRRRSRAVHGSDRPTPGRSGASRRMPRVRARSSAEREACATGGSAVQRDDRRARRVTEFVEARPPRSALVRTTAGSGASATSNIGAAPRYRAKCLLRVSN